MYKVLKRTCWAIVLPIRSFVFPRPHCRRRRGLLKVPAVLKKSGQSEARMQLLPKYWLDVYCCNAAGALWHKQLPWIASSWFLCNIFINNLCSLPFRIFHVFSLAQTCRILQFVQPEKDNYLENHVIKSFLVDNKDQCEVRCYAEDSCSTFNLGISETRGKFKCELSDSDHFQHPENLIRREGFSYHPTIVYFIFW